MSHKSVHEIGIKLYAANKRTKLDCFKNSVQDLFKKILNTGSFADFFKFGLNPQQQSYNKKIVKQYFFLFYSESDKSDFDMRQLRANHYGTRNMIMCKIRKLD